MTSQHAQPTAKVHDIFRWWPLIILPALIAAAAGALSASRQVPSYSTTTRLEVLPLAQWDETFLGISLIRDSGDAKITAATTAALLDSPGIALASAEQVGDGWTPESVAAAVSVSVVDSTNVIEIVAKAPDADRARRLSEGFARAALAERWRTISAELDGRIAAMAATNVPESNPGEAAARTQTLTVIRQAGSDPTLRVSSTSTAVRQEPMPVGMVVGLAAAGGLFVGLLAAFGMLRLRRPRLGPAEPVLLQDRTPLYSTSLER